MTLTDKSHSAIAEELGNRLKAARLNANLTQIDVAEQAGVTRKAVINAEKGKTTLEVFVAIMAALNLLQQLDHFLPYSTISPIQLAKLHGKTRQRASGQRKQSDEEETPSW